MGKKNRKRNKVVKNNKSGKELLAEQEAKAKAEQLKHDASKRKVEYVFDIITSIMCGIGKILLLIIFGLAIAACLFFLGWAIYAYLNKSNEIANAALTIMQFLSGLISVCVGIWALVLTIRSNKKQNTIEENLNINRSVSGNGIQGVPDAKDVNPNSL